MLKKSYRSHLMSSLNWTVASLFALIQFLLQASSGLMASSWQREFYFGSQSLSSTEVGFLSSAFYISYVSMQIPVGLLFDRFGARKTLSTAALLMCIGCLGLGLSHQYWQAFLARILMGIGCSFGFIGMLYVTSSWFSGRHFALMVGISETFAMLGVAFGEMGMAAIVMHYGWRQLMFIAAILTFAVFCLTVGIIRDKKTAHIPENPKPSLSFAEAIKQVLTYKVVWMSGLYGFALFSIINVFVTLWGVPFFTQVHNYSLHTAGSMMSMVFIGTGVGAPLLGWIMGRWQHTIQTIMTTFAAFTAISFGLVIYSSSLPIVSIYLLLFLVGFFSACYIQVFTIIRDATPSQLMATALGTANMVFMLSAPMLQPLVGKVIELQYSFPIALSIIEALLVVAIAISFGLIPKKDMAIKGNYAVQQEISK